MGRLHINDLQFRCKHGYHDFERESGNTFSVDVQFETDLSRPGASDRLEDALDYSKACALISEIMHGPPVRLIEHLLYQIGEALFVQFPEVSFLQVSIRKHQPPLPESCQSVEVTEVWKR